MKKLLLICLLMFGSVNDSQAQLEILWGAAHALASDPEPDIPKVWNLNGNLNFVFPIKNDRRVIWLYNPQEEHCELTFALSDSVDSELISDFLDFISRKGYTINTVIVLSNDEQLTFATTYTKGTGSNNTKTKVALEKCISSSKLPYIAKGTLTGWDKIGYINNQLKSYSIKYVSYVANGDSYDFSVECSAGTTCDIFSLTFKDVAKELNGNDDFCETDINYYEYDNNQK